MKKQAFNPYLPSWEYIADGEPRVFGDRIYIFGSHDQFDGAEYCENDYVCWSADVGDLCNWRYEGVIFAKEDTPWNTERLPLYAPDVVQGTDGRFYLYYSVKNSSRVSVAVCDTPAGRYRYMDDVHMSDGHPYGVKPEEWFLFDPSVLVDTDGRIWLYCGSGQTTNKKDHGHPVVGCFVMELAEDMATVISEPKILLPADWSFRKASFFEGASARHIGEWYYLVYPATNMTGLNYAVSKKPDGPFEPKGSIHSSSDIGLCGKKMKDAIYPIGNSHGGLVCIRDQWYIFDHRQTNGSGWNRQGVAEKVVIKPDGTIDMAESTSCGLNPGSLKGKGMYPAYICCNLTGRKMLGMRNPMKGPRVTQDGPDYTPVCGGHEATAVAEPDVPVAYVAGIKKGCCIGYKYFDMTDTSAIVIRARNLLGRLALLDGPDGKKVAESEEVVSADWQDVRISFDPMDIARKNAEWSLKKCPVFLTYTGKGKIDLLQFELI